MELATKELTAMEPAEYQNAIFDWQTLSTTTTLTAICKAMWPRVRRSTLQILPNRDQPRPLRNSWEQQP